MPKDKERKNRRAKRMQQRADGAKDLAIAKAETAGLGEPDLGPRGPLDLPSRGLPTDAGGKPKARAQRNFTDPDSHIMKGPDGYIQGYNAQAAVDSAHQIIVAIGVSNQAPDVEHLNPMLERIKANTGALPKTFSADTGFCSEANIEDCEQRGLDAYIPNARQKHGARTRPSRGPVPKDQGARERMDRKLRSKGGKEIYSQRKAIVEPVFGQTKEARGLRRFLLRGLEKVNGEWSLWCTGHNLLKLFRATTAAA